jgi:glycine C-acetyltransferase
VITSTEDAILSDELNHASIIDGVRLSKARRLRYRHLDMEDLERQLQAAKDCRRRIIATDGVFSMDGDFVSHMENGMLFPISTKLKGAASPNLWPGRQVRGPRVRGRLPRHRAGWTHGTGIGGAFWWAKALESERLNDGVYLSRIGMPCRAELLNSTLGKALGGAMGGYTVGSAELVALLRQRSRPYLFSNSLAPAVVGSALKALEMLSSAGEQSLIDTLAANVAHFRRGMAEAGFQLLGHPAHPICPILLGEAKLAADFAEQMLAQGWVNGQLGTLTVHITHITFIVSRIYVIGFSFPVVPRGKARIRVQVAFGLKEYQKLKPIVG